MTYQKAKEEIIESSPQKTDAGKEELYLYSLMDAAWELKHSENVPIH